MFKVPHRAQTETRLPLPNPALPDIAGSCVVAVWVADNAGRGLHSGG